MKTNLTLAIILILGAIIRFYQLANLPLILNRDEAALAYNAFLIEESGHDEWEQSWPILFRSFGDYKLPGYIYFLAAIFRLTDTANDWLTRLPAAAAGTGLILVSYLFGQRLFAKKNYALLVALLTALSPVMIFYSRMAWEATLALFFLLIGWWWLTSPQLRWLPALAGGSCFLLAILTYNTPLLLAPILIGLLIINYRRQSFSSPKLAKRIILGLIFLTLLGLVGLMNISSAKSQITIFNHPTVWANFITYREQLPTSLKLFGHQWFYWLKIISQNLVATLGPNFLVFKGGQHPWHNLPTASHLLFIVYLLGLIGLLTASYKLLRQLAQKISQPAKSKMDGELLNWLVLTVAGLAPAIITFDAPHATRSLLFLWIWPLWAGWGIKEILAAVNRLKIKMAWKKIAFQTILATFLIIFAAEAGQYLYRYFWLYPSQQKNFYPGFDTLVTEVNQKFPAADVAVVADGYQYILAAWYLKLPPRLFFETTIKQNPDQAGLNYGEQVFNWHFIAAASDRTDENLLVQWDNQEHRWIITQ